MISSAVKHLAIFALLTVTSAGAIAAEIDNRIFGAWALDRTDCPRLFQRGPAGLRFKKDVNPFETAYVISRTQIRGPSSECSIARASRAGDTTKLQLVCKNSVGYLDMSVNVTVISGDKLSYGFPGIPILDSTFERCVAPPR